MYWFGIPTNETVKDKRKSNKYQYFVSISLRSFVTARAVTMIYFAVSLNTWRSQIWIKIFTVFCILFVTSSLTHFQNCNKFPL